MNEDQTSLIVKHRIDVMLRWLDDFYTPVESLRWMVSKQPLLNGDIPAELLSEREGFERVRSVIEGLRDGVYI